MNVTLKSNSREVATAFRDLARQYPGQIGRVLSTVGLALKKDMSNAIQGKGPVPVAKLNPLTMAWRKHANNRKRTIGGRLPSTIRYSKRGNESVSVGTIAGKAFSRFQTAENREWTDSERFLLAQVTNPDLKGETFFRIRHYANQIDFPKDRPARPVVQPLADSPALAARILTAGRKAVERMAASAARKAAAARAA